MDKSFLKFIELLEKFNSVERVVHIKDSDRWENDAEHSYQMAMLSWYLISTKKLKLNLEKTILLCLVHDLVEAHAGDSFLYDDKKRETKKQREAEALEKIRHDHREFAEMSACIDEYEAETTPEARFVKAIDKFVPVLNIYLDNGRSWKESGVSLDNILDKKNEPLSASPELSEIWRDLKTELTNNSEKYFVK